MASAGGRISDRISEPSRACVTSEPRPGNGGEMKVAILDDYQNVALRMADWSSVASRAEITVFNEHVADPEAVIERLRPFDVICVMRERTLERLPQLKLIASTARRNAS